MDNGFTGLSLADFTRSHSVARETFCKELIRPLTTDGFVVLRDHPVSGVPLDQAYAHCAAVFAQADEIKCRYAGGLRGDIGLVRPAPLEAP
jgi:isopenicillin N synthase-like dioxygenase